jgi:hypothetical protein
LAIEDRGAVLRLKLSGLCGLAPAPSAERPRCADLDLQLAARHGSGFWHGCGTPHEPVPAGVREGTGRCPVMVVPWLGADRTSSLPPRAASRSAMFRWPEPSGVWLVSEPAPSSDRVKRSVPFCLCRQMRARVAWAYLAVFCKASRQQKYTAASVCCGKRPIPSASTVTGSGDLLAWAPSAAASPRSASSGG